MTDDLIARLRAKTVLETYKDGSQLTLNAHPLGVEAADTIEAQRKWINFLEAEIADYITRILRIEATLQFYSCGCDLLDARNQRCGGAHDKQFCGFTAREALGGNHD